ncbi:sirohydrochlorin cobaltochelatase [Pseudoduganella flava]|uniref:Cobalamin biosynthesis protein CbiX n=1 Tax=Pseudoduganella flava TaxID=871742 RepID=A0A562Q516_9BURK|nr:CbiX/SirB N-terminal domain-containing protein [Pseudoduganella flava]QGZ41843.1 cobalamin biosynthesis protein CbiX [Pseudoduganella flava]TWI51855.1 sirohydrochlorin cobaltochelatase [Pseudoduganella flava]
MTQRALILFAHGARAASWAAPFERLRDIVAAREPGVDVSLAFLELMTPGLPERAAQLVAQGVTELTIVPVFLGQGGHVLRDLPVMIEQLKRDHPALAVRVAEAAGENAAVLQAIADYCVLSVRDGA